MFDILLTLLTSHALIFALKPAFANISDILVTLLTFQVPILAGAIPTSLNIELILVTLLTFHDPKLENGIATPSNKLSIFSTLLTSQVPKFAVKAVGGPFSL